MPLDISDEAKRRAREAFRAALSKAMPAYELGQLRLFHDDDEKFIREEVARRMYEPQLPNGGSRERKFIERLKKLARDTEWDGHWRAAKAVKAWIAVLPDCTCGGAGCSHCWKKAGRYYIRKPLKLRENKEEYKWLSALRDSAHMNKLWEQKWFAQMLLDGLPEPVSNFKLQCKFLLRDAEGNVTRLVQLTNTAGESCRGPNPGGCQIMTARDFCAPEKFREWCLFKGNFDWSAGVTELHKLHDDVAHDNAWRVVNHIHSCGWHSLRGPRSAEGGALPGMWFYDECAYVNGKMVQPDDEGIIWHDGEGYFLSDKGRESAFVQGRPKMHPELKLEDLAKGALDVNNWVNKPNEYFGVLQAFWQEANLKYFETLAGFEGYVILGAVIAYAAAPEIFADYRFCSGLWAHGQRGSGKTSGVGWAMNIWGFRTSSGIALAQKTSTAVGILQQAENYSYLPLWLDEFRDAQVSEDKAGILRNAYDRAMQAKWSPDGKVRNLKTGFVVSGESTSSDGATRNRYPHVQFSADKRLADHEDWFTRHAPYFFLFGRHVMENRDAYVKFFRQYFESWLSKPGVDGVDERERKVHGVVYAGWMAMEAVLNGAHDAAKQKAFEQFMLSYCKSAAMDVSSETNVNVFWSDLITAYKAGQIPSSCFKVTNERVAHPPDRPNQSLGWKSYKLYMDPEQVLAHLQIFMTKQHGSLSLKRKDLRDQMSKQPYWIEGKLRVRFEDSGPGGITAWGIEVDKHPLGYQAVSDEDADQLLTPRAVTDDDPGDPRQGPLYAIVLGVEQRKRAHEQAKI